MSTPQNRTPCVGICSTTYGDLVCRGCKRFAHEIVQWNGYSQDQQARVWKRLLSLRSSVVSQAVQIVDADRLQERAAMLKIAVQSTEGGAAIKVGRSSVTGGAQAITSISDKLDLHLVAYEVLRRAVRHDIQLSEVGLRANSDANSALSVLKHVDAEVYHRSLAYYERSFKVPAN